MCVAGVRGRVSSPLDSSRVFFFAFVGGHVFSLQNVKYSA